MHKKLILIRKEFLLVTLFALLQGFAVFHFIEDKENFLPIFA